MISLNTGIRRYPTTGSGCAGTDPSSKAMIVMNRTESKHIFSHQNSPLRSKHSLVSGTALILFLILAGLLPACPAGNEGGENDVKEDILKTNLDPVDHGKEKSQILVIATRLNTGPIHSFIEVSSDVESLNRVDIYPLLSGLQILEVLVDEGDFVEKGTVLARLDDAEIALELEQAKVASQEAEQRLAMARIVMKEELEKQKSAEIQAKKARKDYDKALKLLEDELIAEEEFETDRLAWEQASSSFNLARLQNDRAGLDLELSKTEVQKSRIAEKNTEIRFSRTRIKAPFNAFVTSRGAVPGMTISTTSLLFTLVDSDILVANLYVPQEELRRIKTGQPVLFTCDALPGTDLVGSIHIINPVVDPATGTVKLRAKIDSNAKGLLLPGMFINARIITASRDQALLIPRKAVFYDEEKPTFFQIEEGGIVRKIHFEPGATTEIALEIASTLTPGDPVTEGALIVVVGQDNLKDGDRVEIKNEIL